MVAVILLGVGMQTSAADVVNRTLSNGIRVVVMEDHTQPAVFVRVLLPRGENDDPAGQAGLSDITAELMPKGAGKRNADEIAELLDGMGADLVAESGEEYTILGCNTLTAHINTALDVLRDVVLEPRMEKKEFSLIKDQMTANIKAQRSSPAYLAAVKLIPAVFGPAVPQGNVRTEESLNAIRLEDARRFHRQSLQGSGAIAFCIGDVDAGDMANRLERMLSGLAAGTTPRLLTQTPENLAPDRVIEVDKKDLTQTTVLMGKPGPGRLSPQYYSTLVANYVLGGGGFVSRLMAAVRGKEGKTYGIRSSIPSGATPDLFNVKFTTRNEELTSSLQLTLDVIGDFIEKGPTDTEVSEAKDFFKGYFFLQTETPSQRASKMLSYIYYGLGLEEFKRYPEQIDAVSRQSAHEAAKQYLTADRFAFCLVGPAGATRPAREYLMKRLRIE